MKNSQSSLFGPHIDLLEHLKRVAKVLKVGPPPVELWQAQDLVAMHLNYGNWSQLHKALANASNSTVHAIRSGAEKSPALAALFAKTARTTSKKDTALEEMEEWVRSRFTPLVNFAFHDSESENGYAWADEDLDNALQEQFGDKYPLAWIQQVAVDLEVSEGPWGIEDYGSEDDV